MSGKDKTVYQRFAELQVALGKVGLNATNPHFKNKYATLPHILDKVLPVVSEHGFAIVTSFNPEFVMTSVMDPDETDPIASAAFPLPQDARPQILGAAITYGRRYGLSAVLNLRIDEDDDGNQVQAELGKPVTKKQAKEVSDLLNQLPEERQQKFKNHYGIEEAGELKVGQYRQAVSALREALK